MSKAKRDYGSGSLRQRGPDSWELRIHALDPKTGRRIRKSVKFTGSRLAAKARLRDLARLAADGALPDDKQLFGGVLDAWESSIDVSAKTAERYRELVRLHIRPHLGASKVRAVSASRIEQFYSDLRKGVRPDGSLGAGSLAPRTVGHIHRLVVQAFALAERDKVILSNPARHAKRPKIVTSEIEILNEGQVRDVLAKLRGRSIWLIAAVGLATGLRRGELLALRWRDLDLDSGMLQVERTLEQTKAGLRFKEPKTKRGRRQLSIPSSIATELRAHRRKQSEARLALGLGKDAEDGLVFRQPDGAPLRPNSLTTEWRRLVASLKLPKVSLHAWRHTHASQLIAAGMDVLTISRRLGHGSPSITLDVYSHLFKPTDGAAASVFEAAFSSSFGENIREQDGTK